MLKNNNSDKKLKIGVFGGTFNPPHIGHVQAAESAFGQLNLDKLIVVPAGIPPHKDIPTNTPSARLRQTLSELAFGHMPNTIICDLEITRSEPSYTIDTITKIHADYPNSSIFLLMGSDMFLSLETWKDFKNLFNLVTPAVFFRNSSDYEKVIEFSKYIEQGYSTKTEIIENQVVDISSSELREALPKREGAEYITDYCYSYILKNSLYNVKSCLNWLRRHVYLQLNPSRIKHTYYCEQAALSLAQRWGVDLDDAGEAALLHDITKHFSKCQHAEILNFHDIIFDISDDNVVKLLHCRTGALVAKREFSVSDNVAQAIRWHTTGRRGMTKLEKIIYIADYIELTRNFPEVNTLRELAYENLDDAVIMGLEITITDITSRAITPDETSVKALCDLNERKLK